MFFFCCKEEEEPEQKYISCATEINTVFKIPITFESKIQELKKCIVDDLELIALNKNSDDVASSKTIFEYAFQPSTSIGKLVMEQFSQYYSTDHQFIKDTQRCIKEYEDNEIEIDAMDIMKKWSEFKYDSNFKEKYMYVEWQALERLNHSSEFLQILSIYNLASPVLSLLVPILILIIPFFILQIKGIKISYSDYSEQLKKIASNHMIGKLFSSKWDHTVSANELMYLFVTVTMYIFSIYQNFLICIRFHKNMKKIHEFFHMLRIYLSSTIDKMDNFYSTTSKLKSYYNFHEKMISISETLKTMNQSIKTIHNYNIFSISTIGYVMQCWYKFNQDKSYHDAIVYSLGFHGFLENVRGLQKNIKEKKLSYTGIKVNKKKKSNTCKFSNSYYPTVSEKELVKNTIHVKENMIITGPNASGKTTILKSCIINILLSQVAGCGFCEKGSLVPFDYIHCYLNIPDTSGRDSLFQAECRRCKDIIDSISKHSSETHFCIFDELYSGTNPKEASQSATAFMSYITSKKNMKCMLTTHFTEICTVLEKTNKIKNYRMQTVVKSDNDFEYKYKLEEGISNVCGGIKVLRDMAYPDEIIDFKM
jgi:hypothetical protein